MEILITTFGLVGVVIIIAALLSGAIEKTRFPQVAVFILIGAVLGPAGLNLLDVNLRSPMVQVVATLSLALVLFTDAVSLNLKEVKTHARLAFLILGPGTLIIAFLIGIAAWQLLGFAPAPALLLGAALASTDPVMLRALTRSPDLPVAAKQALRLESGLNDVVLLPIILICMALLQNDGLPGGEGAKLAVRLFVLGPGAGVLVGLFSIGVLELIRRRFSVRRDYESLYSLGVALLAFAAAESVHGSGFLAAFAAGLVITVVDVELCDCFLEYGETTAEMALLFTFVLFGTSLIWQGLTILSFQTILFAIVVVLIRPLILFLTLLAERDLDPKSRLLISWFGPRGLSSLLLILLPVFAGIQGSTDLFAAACLVVLLSVVLHGGSQMLFLKHSETEEPEKIDKPETVIAFQEMMDLKKRNENVIALDVRTERALEESGQKADGAIRIHPDRPLEEARRNNLPKEAWLIAFCA